MNIDRPRLGPLENSREGKDGPLNKKIDELISIYTNPEQDDKLKEKAVKEIMQLVRPKLQEVLNKWPNINNLDKEDVIQETFIKAFNALNEGKYNADRPVGWFKAICKNILINIFRKNQQKKSVDTKDVLKVFSSSTETPDDILHTQQIQEAFSEFLSTLSTEDKEVFEQYLAGNQYKGIAAALNLAEGTVKSKIFRLRASFLEILHAKGLVKGDTYARSLRPRK